MKILLFYFITAFSYITLYSQNIVKNPSFEDYVNPSKDIYYAKDWSPPNRSTIDYYSEICSKNPEFISFTYPCNSPYDSRLGYHPPYDGNAYIGMVLIGWNGGMEHYMGTLISPLIKDSIYNVVFYIRYGGDICWIYSTRIEILFTKEKLHFNEGNFLYLFDIERSIIADIKIDIHEANETRTWLKCHARFKASGGEQYLTFGLFNQENNKKLTKLINKYNKISSDYEKQKSFVNKHETELIYSNSNCKQHKKGFEELVYAYYFIDSVSVNPVIRQNIDYTIPAN